jgi:membrane fusion protein (multidrug efflux system)
MAAWLGRTRVRCSAALRGRRQPLLLTAVALALAVAGGSWLKEHWGIEETDNAQLQAHLVDISSRVAGTITAVPVQDDQAVGAGDPLVLLDPRDARIRLQRAEADLQEARQQASALQAQTGSTASDAAAAADQASGDGLMARAELERAAAELQRLEFLLRQGGVSRQEVERARATYRQAQGQLTRSLASALQARASARKIGVDRQKAAAAGARISQAEASLREARLQLSYTRIVAPAAGRIGSRSAEPGRQVQPGQPLMTLVAPRPWVEAHFKETQLAALRPGQAAAVSIDAFPDRRLHGHVLSVAPASGARFALLPPDNATGNFTKVVQRVTARIGLDDVPADLAPRLVPGLSATVRVRRP